MTTIIKLTKDKSNYFKLTLSSGDTLRVSEDILVRYRLLKGQEITDELLDEIKKASSYDIGLQLALNYLSYQLRSTKEIRTYLKEKEILKEDQEKIIKRLKEMNLLDDRIFSESYVRTAMNTTDKGPRMIAQFLRQKGIADEDIQYGLTFYPEEAQIDVVMKVAQAAMKRYQNKSYKDALQKVKLHLIQRGFSSELAQQALTELDFEKDDEQEFAVIQKQGDILWKRHQGLDKVKRTLKIKQSLYQKGFDYDLIQQYLNEKEQMDEEE